MEEVKCYWETANIVHFLHLFRHPLKLPLIDFETLERAIVSPPNRPYWENQAAIRLLDKVISCLLNGYFKQSVHEDNYEKYLRRIIEIEWVEKDHRPSPFISRHSDENEDENETTSTFHQLPVRTKVQILYKLCEYRISTPDSAIITANFESDELRVDPIGCDSRGYVYWYFHGTRLYRENPKAAKMLKNRFKSPVKEENGDITEKNNTPKARRRVRSNSEDTPHILEGLPVVPSEIVPLPLLKDAWCVVCSTLEDWINLSDNLVDSKIETDRKLGRKLKEDFIPNVKKVWDKREQAEKKEIMRHIMELLPRRTSNRLEEKQTMKEEQERRAQEELMKEQRLRAEAEERLKREAEELAKQRVLEARRKKKEEEDQLLAKKKLKLDADQFVRPDNALSEQEKQTLMTRLRESPRETRMKSRFREIFSQKESSQPQENLSPENETELYAGLSKVIKSVCNNRESWPFKNPVDEEIAPNYYEVIEHPIDLSLIKKKIEERLYRSFSEVEKDFKLLVNNCERYNGPRNGYTAMSHTIWRQFKKAAKHFMDIDCADEQSVFLCPPRVIRRPKLNNDSGEQSSNHNLSSNNSYSESIISQASGGELDDSQQSLPMVSNQSNPDSVFSSIEINEASGPVESPLAQSDIEYMDINMMENFSHSNQNDSFQSSSHLLTGDILNGDTNLIENIQLNQDTPYFTIEISQLSEPHILPYALQC